MISILFVFKISKTLYPTTLLFIIEVTVKNNPLVRIIRNDFPFYYFI